MGRRDEFGEMGLWFSEMWVGEMGRRSREEMREALEREKNGKEKKKKGEKPEREEERKRENIFFNERRERSLIKYIYIYIYILAMAPLLQHAF